jgi:hypothetical protein
VIAPGAPRVIVLVARPGKATRRMESRKPETRTRPLTESDSRVVPADPREEPSVNRQVWGC